jgi:hypothetical protein
MSGARRGRGLIALLFVVAAVAPDATSGARQIAATGGRQIAANDRLTVSEYIAQLDLLDAAIRRASTDSERAAVVATSLPSVWRVQAPGRLFEISTAPLARDVGPNLLVRLRTLRAEAASFDAPPRDRAAERARLSAIVAAREFQGIHGPTWTDRLLQRVVAAILRLLGVTIESSVIPTIGNIVVYALIATAFIALAWWIYHFVRRRSTIERIVPDQLPLSPREWRLWLEDARAASARGQWREAVHLAYWCGIAFLESKGAWRPDRARTPREYLRLLRSPAGDAAALAALTTRFELIWYGTSAADARAFAESIDNLKALGCPAG